MNEDRSVRYHQRQRRAAVLSAAWSAGLLAALVVSGGAVVLRSFAEAVVGRLAVPAPLVPSAVVAAFVLVLGLIHEAGALPLAFHRTFLLEHRFGLSRETAARWAADESKALLLNAGFSVAGFAALYFLIRLWPSWWWAAAGAGFASLAVVFARLAPVLLLPLFFTFRPLPREALRQRLVSLSRKAGVRVLDACEWRLSDRTKKANAALTGLGRSRRILVSDTLLANHTDDEVEAVLAHELGHSVHGDIWKGIFVDGLAAFGGFYAIHLVLEAAWRPLGWRGTADPAGLPLFVLAAGVLSLVLLPVANALSRARERAADRFACDLTGNPLAFAAAIERLASLNLAERRPSRVSLWLFHAHPPVDERVASARARAGAPPTPRARSS